MEDIDFAAYVAEHEQKQPVAPVVRQVAPQEMGFLDMAREWINSFENKPKPQAPYQPTVGGARKRPSAFTFKRGDVRGNLQQILHRAESPDYITLSGGRKVRELPQMTVAQIGRQFGNKAAGRYQIQRDTAYSVLRENGLDPESFRFDKEGQEKLFDMLLNRRGIKDFQSGKMSKEQFARKLSMEWAGLPKDESGISYHAKVGKNKAHVKWQDILAALD
jgi:muramidase (phage lysozyme)